MAEVSRDWILSKIKICCGHLNNAKVRSGGRGEEGAGGKREEMGQICPETGISPSFVLAHMSLHQS